MYSTCEEGNGGDSNSDGANKPSWFRSCVWSKKSTIDTICVSTHTYRQRYTYRSENRSKCQKTVGFVQNKMFKWQQKHSSPAHWPVLRACDESYILRVVSSSPGHPEVHCDRSQKDETGRTPLTQIRGGQTCLIPNTWHFTTWANGDNVSGRDFRLLLLYMCKYLWNCCL